MNANTANTVSNNAPNNAPNNTAPNVKPNIKLNGRANGNTNGRANGNTNGNVKALNKTNTVNVNNSSFVNASNFKNNFKNLANTATNVANAAKNTFNKLPSDITGPINESIQNTNAHMSIPIIIALGILIVLFIIVVIFRTQIAIGLEVVWEKLKGFFEPEKPPMEEKKEVQEVQEMKEMKEIEKILPAKKEVFNIAQDKYSYSDAEPLCKAFGAELATYDQVKEAWKKGADWCNYGWVKGQAALFPTQESTYNKLQTGAEDQRMACGIPGVNGGYFDNPELKFGVNCYGTKPSENDTDIRATMAPNDLTPGALEYDRKVNNYKTQMGQIPVNPFKPGNWSD